MEKIKYHDIFDQLPYGYFGDIVEVTIGAFTKHLHNDIFEKIFISNVDMLFYYLPLPTW